MRSEQSSKPVWFFFEIHCVAFLPQKGIIRYNPQWKLVIATCSLSPKLSPSRVCQCRWNREKVKFIIIIIFFSSVALFSLLPGLPMLYANFCVVHGIAFYFSTWIFRFRLYSPRCGCPWSKRSIASQWIRIMWRKIYEIKIWLKKFACKYVRLKDKFIANEQERKKLQPSKEKWASTRFNLAAVVLTRSFSAILWIVANVRALVLFCLFVGHLER